MTMLETMVVVAIVGTLAALSGPGLIRMVRSARLMSASRELQGLVMATRALAITRGFPTAVCLRGRTFGDAVEGLPLTAATWRKGRTLDMPICTAPGVCPPPVVDPGFAVFDQAAVPADTRGVGQALTDNVSWTLMVPDDRVMTLVFDHEGRVTGFDSDHCGSVGVANLLPPGANGFQVRLINDADVTLTQDVLVRVDGTVIMP